MCRLFGLIANQPVDLVFSFLSGVKTLKDLSNENPDGWGVGWYDDELPRCFKEPLPAHESLSYPREAKTIRTQIAVAHVRKATTGEMTLENCHPFCWNSWIFAHNGSIKRDVLFALLTESRRKAVQGSTDSEVLFHLLLQNIENEDDVIKGIRKGVEKASQFSYSSLNFILSDGISLFAYRDAAKRHGYYSLYYLIRNPTMAGPLSALSDETRMLLNSKSLAGEKAALICSEKLTDENWAQIPLRTLVIFNKSLQPILNEV